MKKILLSGILFFMATAASFAQLPSFNLGIKAGVNLASLSGDVASSDNRLGYLAGVWARVGGAGIYVEPEAYFAGKNNQVTVNSSGNTYEGKARFTTLDVPILLGTKIGANRANLRFMVGPVISFVVNKDVSESLKQVTNFSDYKSQTWGGQVGAGVDIGGVTLDLRYQAGLSNINRSDEYSQKQNLWNLSLGFKIL